MGTIVFRGRAAQRLWQNIEAHPHLLPDPLALESPDSEQRRRAELAAITFMVTAAWGYNRTSDAEYGSRLNRFVYIDRINSDAYRLTRSRADHFVEIHTRAGTHTIDLGRAIGFSAVLPLTELGYRNYSFNNKAMTELAEGDIVSSPYPKHSVRYALIAGLLDFRALVGYLDGRRSFPRTARAVIRDLGCQISGFVPPMTLWKERGKAYAEPDSGRHAPVILCPLSGRGMGGALLRTAGFRPEGTDVRRNRVWVLDLEEINGRRLGDHRFKKLFRINRFIDRNR